MPPILIMRFKTKLNFFHSLCFSPSHSLLLFPPFYFEIRYFVFVQKKHMLAHVMLYVNSRHDDECKYGVLQFIAKATNSFQTIHVPFLMENTVVCV